MDMGPMRKGTMDLAAAKFTNAVCRRHARNRVRRHHARGPHTRPGAPRRRWRSPPSPPSRGRLLLPPPPPLALARRSWLLRVGALVSSSVFQGWRSGAKGAPEIRSGTHPKIKHPSALPALIKCVTCGDTATVTCIGMPAKPAIFHIAANAALGGGIPG